MKKKVGLHAAISLLDSFSIEEPELTLSAISQKTGYPPSSTLRYLKALEAADLVRRDDSKKTYSLGYKVFGLYEIASNTFSLYKMAMPHMRDLRDKINETVALFVEQGNHGVCIGRYISHQDLTHIPMLGVKKPLYTGSRKVLMAHMPENRIQGIISQGLENNTPGTITDPDVLLELLQDIRQKGYCLSGRGLGIKSIGVPIWSNSSVIGVLTVTGPNHRISPKVEKAIFLKAQKTSEEISKKMGSLIPKWN